MGQEIELKIPLSETEYNSIIDVIFGRKSIYNTAEIEFFDVENLDKSDIYYSRYANREDRIKNKEPRVIRIRTEKNLSEKQESESYFTLKWKTVENGIELNREDETFVEKPEVLHELFLSTGFIKYFEKVKHSCSVYCKLKKYEDIPLHLEVEKVGEFFYFEVEYTEGKIEANRVKECLEEFVQKFGLSVEKKDSRSWMEILSKKT